MIWRWFTSIPAGADVAGWLMNNMQQRDRRRSSDTGQGDLPNLVCSWMLADCLWLLVFKTQNSNTV
jgi:hypothetical protein